MSLPVERYRSLSLLLMIFETSPLVLCCGECVCARGFSLNVGVPPDGSEEVVQWIRVLVSNAPQIRR